MYMSTRIVCRLPNYSQIHHDWDREIPQVIQICYNMSPNCKSSRIASIKIHKIVWFQTSHDDPTKYNLIWSNFDSKLGHFYFQKIVKKLILGHFYFFLILQIIISNRASRDKISQSAKCDICLTDCLTDCLSDISGLTCPHRFASGHNYRPSPKADTYCQFAQLVSQSVSQSVTGD